MRVLALDIGGTSIKSGLYTEDEIHELKETYTQAKLGGRAVIERVKEIIGSYSDFDRIGISTAGQVDSSRGVISYANSNIPNYTGTRIKDILEEEFQVPVFVENDAYCAAIGEAWCGAGKEHKDFLCLTYGTGVGGAIVINGNIYKGYGCMAGEFGGILTHPEDRIEDVPLSGCYEQYASTTALIRKAMKYNPALEAGRKIFEKIQEPEVKAIVDDWINEIVYGLTSLIHIFNPPCIILGGGVLSQEYVMERLKKVLYSNIIENFRSVKIQCAALGNKAGLYGAVYIAISQK
jgi:predicted NBD/HSP70 family sugar kinase